MISKEIFQQNVLDGKFNDTHAKPIQHVPTSKIGELSTDSKWTAYLACHRAYTRDETTKIDIDWLDEIWLEYEF